MTWLLILVLWHNDGLATQTIAFDNRAACEQAATKLKAELQAQRGGYVRAATVCVGSRSEQPK